jgi:DinB superfamily
MSELRYPTGRFEAVKRPLTPDERTELIGRIRALPAQARSALAGLTDQQLDTPYRDGGWSPRQIAHHLADSHLNAFVRMKLALTEDKPTVKPYDQAAWSEQPDVRGVPVGASLAILDGLHQRWAELLGALGADAFSRKVVHPEIGEIDLDFLLQMYGWHGRHHLTQVTELRRRRGW